MYHVPLNIPLSFCIPKVCNDTDIFNPALKTLSKYTNEKLESVKKVVNFDDMHNVLIYLYEYSGEHSRYLMAQTANLMGNDTTVDMATYMIGENIK